MTNAQEPIKAYHLLSADGRLGYGDNREVKVGETLEVDVEPQLCSAGLHASRLCLDTLYYSPGDNPRLCLVEVSGDVKEEEDKICGRRRKVTAMLTSEVTMRLIQEFACKVADMALDLAEKKGGASAVAAAAGRKAVEMARRYLRGDCTEDELEAARNAAMTAWDAAWAVGCALGAAEYAAWTARDVAWAVGCTALAARYAAWAAGHAADAGVPRARLNAMLEEMVEEAIKDSAQSA